MGDNKLIPLTTVTVANKTVAASPLRSLASGGAVRLASGRAILAAASVAFERALDCIVYYSFHVPCDPTSVVLRCVYLTEGEAAEKVSLWTWILWCPALQAAAAVLALVLPSHRRGIRYGFTFVALAAAVFGHFMYAANVRLVLAADPGFLFYRISCTFTICIFAVGDVFCFVKLLVGSEDEE